MPLFPLGDDNPAKSVPVMTWLLIAANAAVFVLFNLKMDEGELQRWTMAWGFDVDHPISRQLLTSMFMHGGWLHILGNMWVLWIVGNNVEDKCGKVLYLFLYLLGGVAAALVYTAIAQVTETNPELLEKLGGRHPPLVGASGAIAAVMGMYAVFFPEARIRLLLILFYFAQIIRIRAKWFIGLTLGLDLLTSAIARGAAAGGVATMAHVGGGAFGLMTALALKKALGGGREGDAWDVHTGFSRTERMSGFAQQRSALGRIDRMAPDETDEIALEGAESGITDLVRAGRVREAIDVYPAYVAMAREQPLPEDVQIEIAHELYRQWLPKEAIPAYLRYLETHPGGPDAAEAKFRLGVLYARGLSRRDDATRWLSEAQREHEDPKIRATAQQLLSTL